MDSVNNTIHILSSLLFVKFVIKYLWSFCFRVKKATFTEVMSHVIAQCIDYMYLSKALSSKFESLDQLK